MLLNALIDLYNKLKEKGEVDIEWNPSGKVHYGIDINDNGTIFQIIPMIDGKKPALLKVPISIEKETGSADYEKYICGSGRYFLGYDFKNDVVKESSSKVTADYHRKLFKDRKSHVLDAVTAFFDRYSSNLETLHQDTDLAKNKDKYKAATFILCYQGKPLTEYREVCEIWENEFNSRINKDKDFSARSLISGRQDIIAKTHPGVSVPGGTNPSLISFNADSFESYGFEQSYNARIGKLEAIKYSSAINYMLSKNNYHNSLNGMTLLMWSDTAEPEYSCFERDILLGMFNKKEDNKTILQSDLKAIADKIAHGEKAEYDNAEIDPDTKFYICGLRANGGRVQIMFFAENRFGNFVQNINKHYDRMSLNNEFAKHLTPFFVLKETVRDTDSINKNISSSLIKSILSDTRYPDELFYGVIDRIKKECGKVNVAKVQIIKMYLSKNCPNIGKEVLDMDLNKKTHETSYLLGRLFAILEKIQKDTGVENLASKNFNGAMSQPSRTFPSLFRKSQYYLKKLSDVSKVYYDRLIQDIMENINSFPEHLSLIEQGEFVLGYYHQKENLYTKKEAKQED